MISTAPPTAETGGPTAPNRIATRTAERIAAALLLVYPAVQVAALVARSRIEGFHLSWWFDRLILLGAFVAASAGLWSGRRWARGLGVALALLAAGVLSLVALLALGDGFHEHWADWVRVVAPATASAVALALLLKTARRSSALHPESRRLPAIVVACGVEAALMCAIALVGLGPLGSRWYQDLLGATQAPGMWLLGAMGYCCGYFNSLVISDVIHGHWGGLTKVGIPILGVANTVGLIPFVLLARKVRRRIASRALRRRESPV